MSGTEPHQNDLLLLGQQVIVTPLWLWHHERSDKSLLFVESDVVMRFSSGTLPYKNARLIISWYSPVGWNPLLNNILVAATWCRAFLQVWELVVLMCLQDGEEIREEDNQLTVMIWCLHYGHSLHEGFCFYTVAWAVLSNGHACCYFLSSWEVVQNSCPSVGCWPISEYMDPCFLWLYLSNHSQGEGLPTCTILCVFLLPAFTCLGHECQGLFASVR